MLSEWVSYVFPSMLTTRFVQNPVDLPPVFLHRCNPDSRNRQQRRGARRPRFRNRNQHFIRHDSERRHPLALRQPGSPRPQHFFQPGIPRRHLAWTAFLFSRSLALLTSTYRSGIADGEFQWSIFVHMLRIASQMRFAIRNLLSVLFENGVRQPDQSGARHRAQQLFEFIPAQPRLAD